MRVYVVRHGESETNRAGLWTGWTDVSLTEKGVNDAMLARAFFENLKIDKIYSSDLSRATETAKTAIPGCEPEILPLLREVNVGNIAGRPLSCVDKEKRAETLKIGYSMFGGETNEEFRKRVTDFMKMLEACDFDTVAVFTHAGFLRKILDEVVGAVLPRSAIVCANCTVGIFDVSDKGWALNSWINLSSTVSACDVF